MICKTERRRGKFRILNSEAAAPVLFFIHMYEILITFFVFKLRKGVKKEKKMRARKRRRNYNLHTVLLRKESFQENFL